MWLVIVGFGVGLLLLTRQQSTDPSSPSYQGPFPGGVEPGPGEIGPTPQDGKAYEPIPGGRGLQYRGQYAGDAAQLLHFYELTNIAEGGAPGDMMIVANIARPAGNGPAAPDRSAYTFARGAWQAGEGADVWVPRGFENGPAAAALVITPGEIHDPDAAGHMTIGRTLDVDGYIRITRAGGLWPPEEVNGG